MKVVKVSPKIRQWEKLYPYSANVCTSNGFTVTVWFNIEPADCSVGYMSPYVDDFCITTRKGGDCEWLKLSVDEVDRVVCSALSQEMGMPKDVVRMRW